MSDRSSGRSSLQELIEGGGRADARISIAFQARHHHVQGGHQRGVGSKSSRRLLLLLVAVALLSLLGALIGWLLDLQKAYS